MGGLVAVATPWASTPPEIPELADATATDIVDAIFIVRRELGVGLPERFYARALAQELRRRGHVVETEVRFVVRYGGEVLGELRADMVVGSVLLELKAVEELHPIHVARTLTYLRLSRKPLALLVNFHAVPLRAGIRRFAWTHDEES